MPSNGHPVALLRFQSDPSRSTLLLEAVQLEQGAIKIQGRSNDAGALRAQVPVSALIPAAE
jgi:hypothetical protein